MLDDILEIAFDFVLDIILEGMIHGAVSKKVPLIFRIALGFAVFSLFAVVTGLLLMAAIKNNSIMLTLLSALVAIGSVYMFVKKYREVRDKK